MLPGKSSPGVEFTDFAKTQRGRIMKQNRQLKFCYTAYIVLGSMLSAAGLAGCSSSVYPASECKSPPPPLTVPDSPRSQCREVSTENAKDWPQKYKDIQYSEENAVYWMRVAFIELADSTQKQLKSDFARALAEVNSADGKYLQLVNAAAGKNGGDYAEATKMLAEAVGTFVNFITDHLQGAAANSITSSVQKNINKAKAAFQELRNRVEPTPAPATEEEQ